MYNQEPSNDDSCGCLLIILITIYGTTYFIGKAIAHYLF